MADFDGIPLLGDGRHGGALLTLSQSPTCQTVVPLDDGIAVELREDVKCCVVRGIRGSSYEEVMEVAPRLVNQALDVLSMRGIAHLALDDVDAFHAAWWPTGPDCHIRLVSTARMVFTASIRAEVRDAEGRLVPPDPTPIQAWQESMRYYRMSELTDDLFDAFRNVYLALESLLSTIEPIRVTDDGRAAEREASWFRRSLATAASYVDLHNFALPTPADDVVGSIYEELHNRVRNRVFHAKDGLQPFLPQDLLHRSEIAEARERYSRLYLALAEHVLDGRFPVGGTRLSRAATGAALEAITRDKEIGLTPHPSPFEKTETLLAPEGQPCVLLSAHEVPDTRGDEYVALMAVAEVANVIDIAPSVGRFGTVGKAGEAAVIESLEGQLALEGFARCEFVISHHVAGTDRRKSRYAT